LLADLYEKAPASQRLSLLNELLRSVGPLALVSVAAGAFASLLPASRWHEARASLDDVMRFTADQVFELASYVEQKSPEAFAQLPSLLPDSRLWIGTASGGLLLMAARQWQRAAASATASR
jgi:hypothetical protein